MSQGPIGIEDPAGRTPQIALRNGRIDSSVHRQLCVRSMDPGMPRPGVGGAIPLRAQHHHGARVGRQLARIAPTAQPVERRGAALSTDGERATVKQRGDDAACPVTTQPVQTTREAITAALKAQADDYVDRFGDRAARAASGWSCANGRARERKLTIGSGSVPIRAPACLPRVDRVVGRRDARPQGPRPERAHPIARGRPATHSERRSRGREAGFPSMIRRAGPTRRSRRQAGRRAARDPGLRDGVAYDGVAVRVRAERGSRAVDELGAQYTLLRELLLDGERFDCRYRRRDDHSEQVEARAPALCV
ncbi:MAG: hypothetical protein QOJ21_2938 [Solirubrobacteraceae bacterium]|nr:hypothetical protein [Solirubrobacteraceae bacterium]